MLKVIGLLISCTSVAMAGFVYADRLNAKKRLFERLTQFAQTAVNDMRGLNSNIFEILQKNSSGELAFFKNIDGESLKDRNLLLKLIIDLKVDKESAELIAEFLIKLGVSDLKCQDSHCQYYAQRFDIKRKDAELLFKEKGRLGITLSSLLASAMFIILI